MPSRSSAIQAQKRAHANAADAKKTDTAERNLYVLENASVLAAKAHHHHGGHPHVPGEFDNALKSIYGTGGGSSAIHPGVGESKSDNTENAANPAVKTAKEKLMRASKLIMVQNRLRDKKVAEKEEKKKAAWADFVTYVLFMIFFSLNSIDGLGESSGFDFTNRLTSVLATSDWTNVNDVSGIHSYLQTKFVPALYSVNFDAVGSETGRGQPKDPSEWAAGWIVQGPVRIAQLRSDTYDCEREQSPVLQTYPFECTRNRILGFSSGSFNEEHEARKAYRGFTYNNPNVDKVAWQRSTAKYTTYQTPQYHNYPAPAFAVLVDPHGPRAEAEAAVKRLESDR